MNKHLICILIVLVCFLMFPGIVGASEINVSPSQSIQSAIDNASDNDTINVYDNNGTNCTYNENLNINKKNLSIVSKGKVTISAKNMSSPVISINSGGNYCSIQGFNILGGANSYGIYINKVNNVTLLNNTIKGTKYGVYIYSGNTTIAQNNLLTNNTVGIKVYNATTNSMHNNNFSNNSYGIIFEKYSTKNNITSNFFNNTLNNIEFRDSISNLIDGNSIFNGDNGIYLTATSGSNNITNNYISKSLDYGIYISSSSNIINKNNLTSYQNYAIYVYGTSQNNITYNNITYSLVGVKVFNSTKVLIRNNCFSKNTYGAILENTTSSTIYINTIDSYLRNIELRNSTSNVILENNITNSSYSIYLTSTSNNNSIIKNSILNPTLFGLYISSSSNVIKENILSTNIKYAIQLINGANSNFIYSNTILKNQIGIKISNSTNNLIYQNNFINNTQHVLIYLGVNNTFYKSNLTSISGGNYWSDYNSTSGSHGIGQSSYKFTGGEDLYPFLYPLLNVFAGESIQNGINLANTTDGKKILILHDNNGTPYTYLENIILNKSLIIRPDGKVTIQSLNTNSPIIYINNANSGEIFGLTIQGSVNSQAISLLNALNWEISYNNITNNHNGILFNNTNLSPVNISINHNNIFNNSHSGIWIVNCSNSIISNNAIFNNTIYGIIAENINGSIISENHFQNNGQSSLQLTNSTNNSILANIISLDDKNSNSWGINIEKGSGNTVNQNSINNSNWGLGLYNTVRNQVNLNTIGNTEYGIGLYNSTENELSSNNISSSSNGMYLQNSENNTLKNNYLLNNNNGISINISQNNTITQNSILNSTENGINIHGASNNTISYNTITNSGSPSKDGSGIDVNSDGVNFSTGNNISYNSVSGSYSHGIVLGEDCDQNTIAHNNLESNGLGHDNWSELQLNHSDKNLIESNLIKNNGNDNGIVIYGSNENTLINNQISDCIDGISSKTGLEDPQSYGNVISSNKITASERGIAIFDNIDCLISANTLTNGNIEINSSPGIVVSSNTIKDLNDLDGLMPISLLNCPGSFVIKNKIVNWTDEISIENSPDSIVAGNTFINYEIFVNPGQSIQEAINSAIVGKTIVVKDNNGSPYTYIENLNINKKIKLKSSGIVTIQSAVNNTDTIQITGHDVSLTGFQITGANGDGCGIRIFGADNTVLINNNVNNNENGILLNNSASTTMDNNTINNNNRNFGVYGTQIEEYRHDIDTTNLINGKPIYYIVGNDITITGADNPGFIALVESGYGIGSSIEGVTISNNYQGIVLIRSNYVGIGDLESCYLSNNEQGLYVWESTFLKITTNNILNNHIGIVITGNENIWGENTISLNNITNNNQIGVLVENCDGNYIKTNNITNNVNGISIINCNHISINEANNIKNNDLGINVTTSGNEIVNNNFINNNIDVMDSGINTYDSGYDGDGNYWDKHQTPNIDSDPDHVDVPLVINENSQDNYPLTHLAEPHINPQ